MKKLHLAAVALTVAAGSTVAACGAGDAPETTTVTVFAAASLKSTFEELAETFEAEHEGVDVQFNFAGSSDLVAQIQEGADADVFASADTKNMDALVAADLVSDTPADFASNTLEIAVPPGNPASIVTLADLTRPGVKLVVCAPQVPCGSATVKVEESSGLDFTPVSEEQNVTDVLNKVIADEADAGLVYVTDVIGAGDEVEGIAFPESSSAVNIYPIATIKDSDETDLAREFADLVLGPVGQKVLADAGFAKP